MKINLGDPFWHFDREQVKRLEPECIYVADLAVKLGQGGWTRSPVAVFYTPTPRDGYTNKYFGVFRPVKSMFVGESNWLVCDATSAAEHEWDGIEKDGEVIFSRWVHDFRSFSFGGVYVDGGAEYTRLVGDYRSARQVKLKIVEGVFRVID